MAARSVIFGFEGTEVSDWERGFFTEADPWGFILFARNLETPGQILRLTSQLRELLGRDAPILIDQEGGRVERMGAPHWSVWEPPLDLSRRLPDMTDRARAYFLRYRVIAHELSACGIDVNCAPMADLAGPATHSVLRDRCYGSDAEDVAALARVVVQAHLAGGVLPVLKHIPGHGRATVDSHRSVPMVDTPRPQLAATDFAAFRNLADLPMAMTAHVIFADIDPDNCATHSPAILRLIRDELGFDGLLMTDDLSMQALTGTPEERVRRALTAGCDMILHCNGERVEMQAVAGVCPALAKAPLRRTEAALALRRDATPFDTDAALQEYRALTQERLDA